MTAETAAIRHASCMCHKFLVCLSQQEAVHSGSDHDQPTSSEPVAVSTHCEGRAAWWWPLSLCQVCCASLVRFCVNYKLMSVAFDRFSFQHV